MHPLDINDLKGKTHMFFNKKEFKEILKTTPGLYKDIKIHLHNAERLFKASKKISKNKKSLNIATSLLIISFEEAVKSVWIINLQYNNYIAPLLHTGKNLEKEGLKMLPENFTGALKNYQNILSSFQKNHLKEHDKKFGFIYSHLNLIYQISTIDTEKIFKEIEGILLNSKAELNKAINILKKNINTQSNADQIIYSSMEEMMGKMESLLVRDEKIIQIIESFFSSYVKFYKKTWDKIFKDIDIKEIKKFTEIRNRGFYLEDPNFNYDEFLIHWQHIIETFIKGLLAQFD